MYILIIQQVAFLAMIPIILLFLFAQKQIIRGMVDGAYDYNKIVEYIASETAKAVIPS